MATSELGVETMDLVKRFPGMPGWRGLVARGPEKLVLDHVSLAVGRGEIFGLLGPNGAGKTTLTKILCTLITPTSGVARVSGLDVVRDEGAVRQQIGLVYGDQRSFFWRLSLVENLRFYAALYRMPPERARRRIDELVEIVGLRDAAHMRMHHFSSGMKQRAAIARGLLSDPEIVFMDEPTIAVDPIAAHDIRSLVRSIVAQDGNRTVLLSTNIMAEAEALCDRIALLNHGRIEMIGTVSTLRERFQPDDRYLLTVGGVAAEVVQRACALDSVVELAVTPTEAERLEVTVTIRRGDPALPEIVRRLVGAGADVWSCVRRELSLEEMFRLSFDRRLSDALPEPARLPVNAGGN